jgi:HEAT repeats
MRAPGALRVLVFLVIGAAAGTVGAVAHAAQATGQVLDLTVMSSRITLSARDVPLADVLTAIGRQTGVKILLQGDLSALVTEMFVNVPLDEGIRRLSRGHSVVFIYAGASAPARDAALSEVWVMSASPALGSRDPYSVTPRAGAGRRDDGRAADTRGSTASERPVELTRELKSGTLETRLRLIEAVVRERGEYAALDILRDAATHDADPRVRRAAIQVLTYMPSPDAVEAIRATLGDRHAGVRAEALNALRQLGQAPGSKRQVE